MKKSTYLLQGILLLALCTTPVNGISEERSVSLDHAWTDIRFIPATVESAPVPKSDPGLAADKSTKTVYPNLFASDAGSGEFNIALNSCERPPAKTEDNEACR